MDEVLHKVRLVGLFESLTTRYTAVLETVFQTEIDSGYQRWKHRVDGRG